MQQRFQEPERQVETPRRASQPQPRSEPQYQVQLLVCPDCKGKYNFLFKPEQLKAAGVADPCYCKR